MLGFIAKTHHHFYRVETYQHQIGEGIGSFDSYPLPRLSLRRRRYTTNITSNPRPDKDRRLSEQCVLFGQRSGPIFSTANVLPYAFRVPNTRPASKAQVPRRLEIVASPVEFTTDVRFAFKVVIILQLVVVLYTFFWTLSIPRGTTAPLTFCDALCCAPLYSYLSRFLFGVHSFFPLDVFILHLQPGSCESVRDDKTSAMISSVHVSS